MLTADQRKAVQAAESDIQQKLLDLEDLHGIRVDHVNIDCRNFANYRTEIFEVGWLSADAA